MPAKKLSKSTRNERPPSSLLEIRSKALLIISEIARKIGREIDIHKTRDILYYLDLWKDNVRKKYSLSKEQFFKRWHVDSTERAILNALLNNNNFTAIVLPVI